MRILVIEDDVELRAQLVKNLKAKGYVVDEASDGAEGLYHASEYPLDCAIIDLGLPMISGIDVIKKLRANRMGFPILILTAREQWRDKVDGLSAGADDYLVKPFHMEELFARVTALIRRAAGWIKDEIIAGPITLNLSTQDVRVNGELVELTAYEYKVLECFFMRPGQIVTKTTLTEHIYEQDFDKDSNVIEVFVARLRKKLDPKNEYNPIETLRGRGYRFTLKPTEK